MRLTFVLLATLCCAVGTAASPFVHGPYSGAPSGDSVAISWASETLLASRIEYATLAYYNSNQLFEHTLEVDMPEETLSETQHAFIEGLSPATQYVYRVVLVDELAEYVSEAGVFSTAPAMGTPVSFIVISDTQQQLEGVNRLELVGSAVAREPTDFDFVLHGGDVVESPSSYYWDHWFASFSGMLLRAPFIPVLGNHEKNHRSYYENFELPPGAGKNSRRWWALHWGDVVVVGLDTNVRSAIEIRDQQDWARQHLSGGEPHKFVIFHHPVFSSDSTYGTAYFYDSIYHPIFVEMSVDIVFNGHSHHYERIDRDGVIYMVVGGGGATPRRTRPDHIEGSDVSIEGHHFYVRVTASSEGIRVETVSVAREASEDVVVTNGQLLDSFELLLPINEATTIWVGAWQWILAPIGASLVATATGAWFILKRRRRRAAQ